MCWWAIICIICVSEVKCKWVVVLYHYIVGTIVGTCGNVGPKRLFQTGLYCNSVSNRVWSTILQMLFEKWLHKDQSSLTQMPSFDQFNFCHLHQLFVLVIA